MSSLHRGLLPLLITLLAACSGGGDDRPVPAELVPFEVVGKVSVVWTHKLDAQVDPYLTPSLAPAGIGSRIYSATPRGTVKALNAQTGALLWRVELGVDITAGPGIGRNAVAVGTGNGEIILLSRDDGSILWRRRASSEVLAAPAVGEQTVVVRSVDGVLSAYAFEDGEERWQIQRRVQGLTLRGSGAPVIRGGVVFSGFDDGFVAAINEETGDTLWETSLTERRGRTELARLADIDAAVAVVGEDVFAAGYQGNAVLLSVRNGEPVWRQAVSTHHAIDLDLDNLYLTEASDAVVALNRRSGNIGWRQATLGNRRVTAPATTGSHVVVGDLEGYVHWLATNSGRFVARAQVAGGAIVGAPVVIGDLIVVQSAGGKLTALRFKPAA